MKIIYTKISDTEIKKITTKEEIIDTSEIDSLIKQVKAELVALKDEPDEILMPNLEKFENITQLESEEKDLMKRLEVLNGSING